MRLTLRLGAVSSLTDTVEALKAPLMERILHAFDEASGGAIDLDIDPTLFTLGGGDTSNYEELQYGLLRLVGEQQPDNVRNIGLIFAGRHQRFSNYLGVMFDEEFRPFSNLTYEQTPREGAAVFLNTIAQLRSRPDDFQEEAIFTAIHELGHVFNLQHSSHQDYLFPSGRLRSAPGGSYWRFSPGDAVRLSTFADDPHIRPGGSAFSELGGVGSNASAAEQPATRKLHAKLKIKLRHERFAPYEPVELDVSLAPKGDRETVEIPDEVDHGHHAFRILIEDPNGERRFLKSPKHYCARPGKRTITRREPFIRDISLFGEAGGYTFRTPGVHRIRAIYSPAGYQPIRSSKVEVMVRTIDLSDREEIEVYRAMTSRQTAHLLYYRTAILRSYRSLQAMTQFRDLFDQLESPGNALYAYGRALSEPEFLRQFGVTASLRRSAVSALRASLTCRTMSAHRREIAEHRLKAIGG